ncbi:MAG: 50S ribosomal protein L9 [Acidobacteria bacterium]|nr:MAG: 50S ribosomal protein L9 [Acidobacteriota bacterium]
MELILREDVAHLGKRGEIVNVADGYARNYLIPKGLAYKVTPGIRRQVEVETRAKLAREARERAEAEAVAERLRGLDVIRFKRRAGETGLLYGSVSAQDIAAELTGRGLPIERRQVRLEEPIKRIGTHRVLIHVHGDLEVEVVVEVEPEEGDGA